MKLLTTFVFLTAAVFFLGLVPTLTKPAHAQTPACTYTPDTVAIGGTITVTSLNSLTGEIRIAGAFWPQPATGSVLLGNLAANTTTPPLTVSGTSSGTSPLPITAGSYAVRVGGFGVLCTTASGGTSLSVTTGGGGDDGGNTTTSTPTCTSLTDCSSGVGTGVTGFSETGLVGDFISNILPIILGVVGMLTVIMIVISGFQFATSSGNPESTAAARDRLTFALIGFAVVALAFALTQIIDVVFLNHSGIF